MPLGETRVNSAQRERRARLRRSCSPLERCADQNEERTTIASPAGKPHRCQCGLSGTKSPREKKRKTRKGSVSARVPDAHRGPHRSPERNSRAVLKRKSSGGSSQFPADRCSRRGLCHTPHRGIHGTIAHPRRIRGAAETAHAIHVPSQQRAIEAQQHTCSTHLRDTVSKGRTTATDEAQVARAANHRRRPECGAR